MTEVEVLEKIAYVLMLGIGLFLLLKTFNTIRWM